MTRLPLMVTIILTLLLANPSHALHCNGDVIMIDAGSETLYVDHRSHAAGEIDIWLYLESNGHEGLQSGGDSCVTQCDFFGFTDPCFHGEFDTMLMPGV